MGKISKSVHEVMAKQKQKLNLGCGLDYKQGWINIDAVAEVHPDLIHDLNQPLPFENGSVDEILAQDILEHFTKEDLESVVGEISRVLSTGGKLMVRVPNLDDIIERFSDDKEVRNEFLYGTTAQTGIFGAHKVGLTAQSIVALMLEHGLTVEKIDPQETNFWLEFRKEKTIKRLKSITFINQTLGMGGAESFLGDLLEQLSQRIEVNIFTTNKIWVNELKHRKLKAQSIPVVIDVIGNWKGLLKAVVLFPYALVVYTKLVFNNKSELILLSGFPEKVLVSLLSKIKNIPVVWIDFAPLQSIFIKFFRFPKLLYFLAKAIPIKVIVPTVSTKNLLISQAHISLAKMAVIACGRRIDRSKYQNIKKQKGLIVCVSRLEPGKGQDLLIQAMPLILKKNPQAKLVIVGEGDFATQLNKLIKTLKLENQVTLLGRVLDPLTIMAQAEVCVFPSVWQLEGFGLVTIEAMALGKTVVGFDRTPTNEIIHHQQNGLLAKNNDIKDLASQILVLLSDPKLANKLGKHAAQDFAQHYTIEAVAEQYLRELNKAFVWHHAAMILEKLGVTL